MEKLDYCIQDQGHISDSKCQWMFVKMIPSEPQNLFFFFYQTGYGDATSWVRVSSGINLFPIFQITKHFVTKLGIVMHHHKLECHTKRFVCYFQGQGQNKGLYDQNMTVSTISSKLLILLLQSLVLWYIIISQSVLWRNWTAVFKVKVRATFQNVSECLSIWYRLNR